MKSNQYFHLLLINFIIYSSLIHAAQYIENDAKIFVDFAAAAYCSGTLGNGVENWDCHVCQKYSNVTAVPVFNKLTDANGFVGYDGNSKSIIVSFSGTDPLSIRNWIDDIDTIKTDYGYSACGCEVHKGFYDTYLSVQEQVLDLVISYHLEYPNARINVTGHSLGAALAVHAALDITLTLGIDVNIMYTFGQPRVGDDAFEEFYVKKVTPNFRLTHHKDPVPHLPPEAFGFRHNPTEVFYDEIETEYTVCDNSGEDPNCSDKYLADLNVADHLFYVGMDFAANYMYCKL
jgi:hypothetical protein